MLLSVLLLQAATSDVPPPASEEPVISVIEKSLFETCPKFLDGTLNSKSESVAKDLGFRLDVRKQGFAKNYAFVYGSDPDKGFVLRLSGSKPTMCVVSFIYKGREQLFADLDKAIILKGYIADPHYEKDDFKLSIYKNTNSDTPALDLSSMVDRGGANFFVRGNQGKKQ